MRDFTKIQYFDVYSDDIEPKKVGEVKWDPWRYQCRWSALPDGMESKDCHTRQEAENYVKTMVICRGLERGETCPSCAGEDIFENQCYDCGHYIL